MDISVTRESTALCKFIGVGDTEDIKDLLSTSREEKSYASQNAF